jgi:universal stress protein A
METKNSKTGGERAARGARLEYRTVLVPVDFSACSRHAFQYALRFASRHGSRIILLHVVEPVVYPAELGFPSLAALPPQSEYQQLAAARLSELQALAVESAASVQTKVRVGQPYAEIARAARELNADLIIISTHGHTGLRHVLLGSTAERVVRHAACPVLTVRGKAPGGKAR